MSGTEAKGQMREMGLCMERNAPWTIHRKGGLPHFEVHSVRVARRAAPDGQFVPQLVIEITQARDGFIDEKDQKSHDRDTNYNARRRREDFLFRGGCTLIVDLKTRELRYCIRKRIDDDDRLNEQRKFLFEGESTSLAATYFKRKQLSPEEPFALLHRGI